MIFQLRGLLISVRKPELSDIEVMSRWLSSDAYRINLGGMDGGGELNYQALAFKAIEANANDQSSQIWYLVEDRFSREPVALAILSRIDWKNRHAEYSHIVGEEKYRSKLVAADMSVVMNNYFFYQLNLNKIYSYIFAGNQAAIRLTQFGSKADGILRQHRLQGSKATDVHLHCITRAEFSEFIREHASGLLRKHLKYGLLSCPGI